MFPHPVKGKRDGYTTLADTSPMMVSSFNTVTVHKSSQLLPADNKEVCHFLESNSFMYAMTMNDTYPTIIPSSHYKHMHLTNKVYVSPKNISACT